MSVHFVLQTVELSPAARKPAERVWVGVLYAYPGRKVSTGTTATDSAERVGLRGENPIGQLLRLRRNAARLCR